MPRFRTLTRTQDTQTITTNRIVNSDLLEIDRPFSTLPLLLLCGESGDFLVVVIQEMFLAIERVGERDIEDVN